jgi:hypothetical protein
VRLQPPARAVAPARAAAPARPPLTARPAPPAAGGPVNARPPLGVANFTHEGDLDGFFVYNDQNEAEFTTGNSTFTLDATPNLEQVDANTLIDALWLIKPDSHAGGGAFPRDSVYIRRSGSTGGAKPAACPKGKVEADVPYTTTYTIYECAEGAAAPAAAEAEAGKAEAAEALAAEVAAAASAAPRALAAAALAGAALAAAL